MSSPRLQSQPPIRIDPLRRSNGRALPRPPQRRKEIPKMSLDVDKTGRILTVTMNRPEALN
ncbi:MAG: hypothetical protein QGH70_11815, partial [Nitrospinota bacterium]|nr:hypothetical protein [Nitrospinota bacterium]